MKESISTWRERVSAWQASGLSQQKYCADKTFAHQSLQRWSVRLREKPAITVPLVRVMRSARTPAEAAETPDSRGLPSAARSLREPVIVETCGARLLVSSGADVALVVSLVRALREAE